MDTAIQILVSGLLTGALYALVAFGLSIVYGVTGILNFAHGTILACVGVIVAIAVSRFHVDLILVSIAVIAACALFGYIFYTTTIHPLVSHPDREVAIVLITVGLMLIIADLTAVGVSSNQQEINVQSKILGVDGVIATAAQIYTFVAILVITGAASVWLRFTKIGRAVRAVTQDYVGAAVCGVPGRRLHAITVAVGLGTVGIASILYVLNYPLGPYDGFPLTVRAFAILVVGGIGSVSGALYAGLALGVLEAITSFYVGQEWAPAVSIVVLLAYLVIKAPTSELITKGGT